MRARCFSNLSGTQQHTDVFDKGLNLESIDECVQRYERSVVKYGRLHPDVLTLYVQIASLHFRDKNFDQAEKILQECLTNERMVLGEKHPLIIDTMTLLAMLYGSRCEYDKAIKLHEECFQLQGEEFGENHQQRFVALSHLSFLYETTGNHSACLATAEAMYHLSIKMYGPYHTKTRSILLKLAKQNIRMGQPNEALLWYNKLLSALREEFGNEHKDSIQALVDIAMTHAMVGKHDNWMTACSLWEECWGLRKKVLGEGHYETVVAKFRLGEALGVTEQYDRALTLLQECLQWSNAMGKDDNGFASVIEAQYAALSFLAGRETECEAQWSQCWDEYRTSLKPSEFDQLSDRFHSALTKKNDGKVGEALKIIDDIFVENLNSADISGNASDPLVQVCIVAFRQLFRKS